VRVARDASRERREVRSIAKRDIIDIIAHSIKFIHSFIHSFIHLL